MKLAIRTQEWRDRGEVVHVVELVVGGIIFRTEASSPVHAMELALRTARIIGLDPARDFVE